MKKLVIFLFAIMISTISYSQLIPKGFNILTINDVDSALVILKKAAKQQKVMPVFIDVTKEYISQTWQAGKRNVITMNSRTIDIPKTTYYEYITKVYIRGSWRINILNSTTNPDHLTLMNKDMAEQALASILCLIKNSGNKNYDKIVAEITANKK